MKLEKITEYISNKIKPFSFRELAIVGAVCLTIGGGTGYCTYDKISEQKTEYKEELRHENYLIPAVGNMIAKAKEAAKTEKPKEKKKPRVVIINNKKCCNREGTQGAHSAPQPSHQPAGGSTHYTPEGDIRETPLVASGETRTDGYNIIARFCPQNYRYGCQELELNPKEEDYGRVFISSLSPEQKLILDVNDPSENFLTNIKIIYKDASSRSFDVTDYFDRTNNGKHIFLSQKVQYGKPITNGSLLISVSVRNKYGTVENESLEVIIGQ